MHTVPTSYRDVLLGHLKSLDSVTGTHSSSAEKTIKTTTNLKAKPPALDTQHADLNSSATLQEPLDTKEDLASIDPISPLHIVLQLTNMRATSTCRRGISKPKAYFVIATLCDQTSLKLLPGFGLSVGRWLNRAISLSGLDLISALPLVFIKPVVTFLRDLAYYIECFSIENPKLCTRYSTYGACDVEKLVNSFTATPPTRSTQGCIGCTVKRVS